VLPTGTLLKYNGTKLPLLPSVYFSVKPHPSYEENLYYIFIFYFSLLITPIAYSLKMYDTASPYHRIEALKYTLILPVSEHMVFYNLLSGSFLPTLHTVVIAV